MQAANEELMRFSRLFERFLSKGDEDKIDWDKIEPPPPGMVWLGVPRTLSHAFVLHFDICHCLTERFSM